MTTARLIDDEAPKRAPDGEVDGNESQFYFWLGDDGVEDDPEWDSEETPMAYDEQRIGCGDGGSGF